ncbi:hypothetical protein ACORG1_13340 [Mycobacterium sp. TJFP1]
MKISDRITLTAIVVAVVINVVSFALDRDVDKLFIAVLFVSIILWHHTVRRMARAIDDRDELLAATLDELERWQPIAQHEAKFADMPRVAGKPLPAPEGHPEYRRGAK